MPYIYLITNDINGKQYVGKTEKNDWSYRFYHEHCKDYKRERYDKRPLYDAMNKYGIEHFHVQPIEYVSPDTDLEEREIYWIAQYNTYHNGYNATRGGDGKHYADYELIYQLYQEGKSCKEIIEITKYDSGTISKALNIYGISHEDLIKRGKKHIEHQVIQLDKNTNEVLNVFSSLKDAYKFLNKEHSGHIAAVCKGKRKTAYGYKWKYKEEE